MRRFTALAAGSLIALSLGCSTSNNAGALSSSPAPLGAAMAPRALFGAHGFDVTGMDTTVKACDDFYRFAVGKWRDTHPLPAEYSRFGRFEELAERNRQSLRAILEQDAAMTDAAPGSAEQKLGDYYNSCMNESLIESAGLSPIQPMLASIDAVTDRTSLVRTLTALQARGYSPAFRLGGQNDFKNSKMIIASLGTGSIGLPDRDYYLRDDARFSTIRTQYVDHVTKMLALAGEGPADAAADAQRVIALETKLATAMLPRVEQRNPDNVYHITPVSELSSMAPAIDWNAWLATLNVSQQSVNVTQPAYLRVVNGLLNDTPLQDWKAYLRWEVLKSAAPTLTRALSEEEFNFNGKILSGQQQQPERWKRCVRAVDGNLGQILGQEYVKRTFTPEAKAKMNALIDNLVSALREDIPTLSWMGPQTKQAAMAKLDAFARRIGYPDKWIDYTALSVDRNTFAANAMAARQFSYRRNLNRIGKPDDPAEWGGFTPPTVNASYSPSQNNITFPAGILQPPFYDPNADDAYNYGGIGTVIGHEMTHGFDDQGARFDAQGNLRNWFTEADLANFQKKTDCIGTEYSEFNVAPGINIKGKLVTGEATADLGGATLALRAYQKSLAGRRRETLDGFTSEQRFFLGFAQVWGENMAAEEATRRALTDPHAQGPFRVNGTVANMPSFQKAFGCNENAPMVREAAKRCAIW
ncbi:MAG: M13 family metallopeptidase [Thermoanaerobaculia bacterium]